jgi:hypothetical protein
MAVGIRHANHVTRSIRKTLALISPTSGGRSVGIVRSRTQATEFRRASTICQEEQGLFNEISRLRGDIQFNGHSQEFIYSVINSKSSRNSVWSLCISYTPGRSEFKGGAPNYIKNIYRKIFIKFEKHCILMFIFHVVTFNIQTLISSFDKLKYLFTVEFFSKGCEALHNCICNALRFNIFS